LFLNSCAVNPPPLEFAPNPKIIEKAIAFQIQQKQNYLSKQLHTHPPKIQISQINIHKIEPKIEFNLPTYHLEGTYQLKLKIKSKKNQEIVNSFQIDLQRQKQGKTWRLIVPNQNNKSQNYSSYKIK
jgi:hypothetical protein